MPVQVQVKSPVEHMGRTQPWSKADSNRWSHLIYDGDAFQNTHSASPGCTAPEDGPAENKGLALANLSSDCLSMRRSGDIVISSSRSPGCPRLAVWAFRRKWDQRFESAFLQRGVSCEPDFRSESLDPRILA